MCLFVFQIHQFEVEATDGGRPPLRGTVTVLVNIEDVSDEDPEFEHPLYRASVKENSPPGTVITTVKAVDPDTVSQVTYIIVDGSSDLFFVDPESGRISTVKPLDFEVAVNHTLVIGTKEAQRGQPKVSIKDLIILIFRILNSIFTLIFQINQIQKGICHKYMIN